MIGPFTNYLAEVSSMLGAISVFDMNRAMDILCRARQLGANVWIVGNGGSASTAGHFANDLVKTARVHACSLPNEIPVITAFGNDNGWNSMYSDALESLFTAGDVLVAISCSGRSQNVINAAQKALELDGYVIVLTGEKKDNFLAGLAAQAIVSVNHADIRVVEDCHLSICHAIAGLLANKTKEVSNVH